MTSMIIRVLAFALMKDRPRDPYHPPSQWLQMINSALELFYESWEYLEKNNGSLSRRLITRSPNMRPDNSDLFQPSHRQSLLHLLQYPHGAKMAEPWDESTQEAYQKTLSFIGGIHVAIFDSFESKPDIWYVPPPALVLHIRKNEASPNRFQSTIVITIKERERACL